MRSYEERAKDFIKEIFPMIEHCQSVWQFREAMDDFNFYNHRKVRVKNGCARVALITSDYVVKIEYDPYEVESIGGCENEMEVYEMAVEHGFESLFAKITLFQYKDRKFYIMPRINGVGSAETYGDEYMTIAETAFCESIGLTDLHCNNFGFRNGHICIIDYGCLV